MVSSSQPLFIPLFDDFEPDPTLINDDLKPTTPNQRTLSGMEMASLWMGLVVGVPSYYLAGSLVELGMAWWQGIAIVFAANLILLFPLVLMGHAGLFRLARSSFGIRGAHIATLLRALIACGWYGIDTWIGGGAIFLLLPETLKESNFAKPVAWLGASPLEFACFLTFWFVQLGAVWKGMDGIRKLEKYSSPILIILTGCLLIWSYFSAGGFSHMLTLSSRLSNSEFWSLFFPALTANISFWAPLALNIPDFTRYAKTQKDQVIGQAGLPVFMGAFTFVGLAVTSSTTAIFGTVISNPIQLLGAIGGVWTKILSILGISLAVITTSIPANVVATSNALVNLSPEKFTFMRGALLTALIGIALQPWRLLQTSQAFVYTWLDGYSVIMGPIGGIVLADYYLVQKRELSMKDLYTMSPGGAYYYSSGYNLAAIGALIIGVLLVIPGFLQKVGIVGSIPYALSVIYDNAWFFGFFSSGILHCLFSTVRRGTHSLLPNNAS